MFFATRRIRIPGLREMRKEKREVNNIIFCYPYFFKKRIEKAKFIRVDENIILTSKCEIIFVTL